MRKLERGFGGGGDGGSGRGGEGRREGGTEESISHRDTIHDVRQWSLRAMQLRRCCKKPCRSRKSKIPPFPSQFSFVLRLSFVTGAQKQSKCMRHKAGIRGGQGKAIPL